MSLQEDLSRQVVDNNTNLHDKLLACITDTSVEFGISILHVERGEETAVNAHTPFPTASVYKVPIMVEVFKQAENGRFQLNDRLPLQTKYKTMTTGVLLHLDEGLALTIHDLVTLMIIVSDNTATAMLLELVGAENVTQTMHDLGCHSIEVNMTVHEMFLHALHLLDQPDIDHRELGQVVKQRSMDYQTRTFSRGKDNTVSSAHDMTHLMAMLVRGEIISRTVCDEMLNILGQQQYTYRVPRYLPWFSVQNKTGSMRGLRNDSGVICCKNNEHIVFSIFSFDDTALPPDNSPIILEREGLVSTIMADMGKVLWDHYCV